ncbi:GTP cyclohydrolase 1-like [Macadamia integrifolia]|uniref:GTP cyclohydrolase 1-like n=1 Tax=Macadamia integrifolia TaxID=60698 RepID=UPI001C4F0A28|nr:GTP cyclohydrolase 1-like [Macadamia integrifolia]
MGALDDGHFSGELENGVKFGSLELDLEDELDTTVEIEDAVKVLLQCLGEDSNREGLKKTPLRVAKALREGTRGYRQKVKDIVQGALFPEAGLDSGVGQAGGAGGLVVVRDLDLFSYCESCLLPFQVQCHVGYVPSGQRVLGLSKLSRVADVFAKRLQDPQRLADEVCSALHNGINPAGVAVVLQCWHIQFPEVGRSCCDQSHQPTKVGMQGWVRALVYSGSGVFENENGDVWGDLLALLKLRGVNVEKTHNQTSANLCWCPSRSLDVPVSNGHTSARNCCKASSKTGPSQSSMISAVATILHSLGEDPSRKELVGTPHRFVQWLINFKKANLEINLNGFSSAQRPMHQENGNGSCNQDEMHSVINIPFWSQCEHHLLPFHGVVHIGYFHASGDKPIERSILESIVHFYGCKLQVQERLTRQIAETVSSAFGAEVMVVVEANHICMVSRGIEKVGSSTATIAVLGRFSTDPTAKAIFLRSVSESAASGER